MQKKKRKFEFTQEKKSVFFLQCPRCEEIFGITIDFVSMTGDTNFKYHCPYCEFSGGIED